jgi:hypothetical protein
MPVPTHGPSCQTKMYPVECWDCGSAIHILQCSCGSAVLLDVPVPPWDKHDCRSGSGGGGIGGSGLSGWAAVDALRAAGAPISASVMDRIFPGARGRGRAAEPPPIQRVDPLPGPPRTLLALVKEVGAATRRTDEIEALSAIGRQMLGLDKKAKYLQVNLLVNSERPNLSYTCVMPEPLADAAASRNRMVMAQITPRLAGRFAVWLVTELHLLCAEATDTAEPMGSLDAYAYRRGSIAPRYS